MIRSAPPSSRRLQQAPGEVAAAPAGGTRSLLELNVRSQSADVLDATLPRTRMPDASAATLWSPLHLPARLARPRARVAAEESAPAGGGRRVQRAMSRGRGHLLLLGVVSYCCLGVTMVRCLVLPFAEVSPTGQEPE